MDKTDYINQLKDTTKKVQPKRVRVEERKEEVLLEDKSQYQAKFLNELFVKLADAEKIPKGPSRDAQLLRLGIIAEFDAANFYESMAALSDNEDVKSIFVDVSYEEKVHAGEFHKLLVEIDPEAAPSDKEGEEEAEELTED